MMRAPFNFVPLPETAVFYPNWADKVSHEAPFSDSQSGRIHLRITAKTPIFVRQGHLIGGSEASAANDFMHRGADYFIPATSIKGAVRNILEIISFGKLSIMQQLKDINLDKLLPNYDRDRMDLAECIFGKVKGDSLRGRVQFSQAYLKSEPHELAELEVYCGQPKASFYPIYVKQQGEQGIVSEEGYFTLDDTTEDGAYMKGWKRYPVRTQVMDPLPDIPEGQEEHTHHFKPLDSGSVFECDMRYFNLKRVELGALIYAMNLFEGAIYSLGFGKPYGFGQVRIELSGNAEMETLKQEFIELMKNQVDDYEESEQLLELRLMMTEQPDKEPLLNYMSFEEYQEFEDTYLPYYSEISVAQITERKQAAEAEAKAKAEAEEQAAAAAAEQARNAAPVGQLAKVTGYFNGQVKAVLQEGKDKSSKPVIFNSINANHKAALKKLKDKKSIGTLIRVTPGKNGLNFEAIEQ